MAKLPDNFTRDFEIIAVGTQSGHGGIRDITSIPRPFTPPVNSSKTNRELALTDIHSGIYHDKFRNQYIIVVFFDELFPISLGGFTESAVKESADKVADFIATMCEAWVSFGNISITMVPAA